MESTTSIVEQQRAIRAIEREKAEAKKAFDAEQDAMAKRLHTMRRNLAVDAVGLDRQKIERARNVLEIRGSFSRGGDERASVVRDAINVLLDGKPDLRTKYFGTKSYDRWHGQRSDHCYGYGPKHGSVIFAIGLRGDYREADLTPKEVEACVYFLTCIEAIEAAEKRAA